MKLFGRVPCLRRRVLVNLKHDEKQAIEGVLYAQTGQWLTLKRSRLVTAGAAPVEMDGEVVIECSNISFIQAL